MLSWNCGNALGIFVCLLFILFRKPDVDARSMLETNEIVEGVEEIPLDLSRCTNNSICGYLQANAKGINYQRRCACPAESRCPMKWDSVDGQTVGSGSDQYKFCGPAPSLSVCEDSYTAYTSTMIYNKENDEIVTKSDHIHCICPDSHNHVLTHQRFENVDEDNQSMELIYVCYALTKCQIGDYCKTVSQTSTEFLVNRKCVCPDGLRCPTDGASRMKTIHMGNGLAHFIRCQH